MPMAADGWGMSWVLSLLEMAVGALYCLLTVAAILIWEFRILLTHQGFFSVGMIHMTSVDVLGNWAAVSASLVLKAEVAFWRHGLHFLSDFLHLLLVFSIEMSSCGDPPRLIEGSLPDEESKNCSSASKRVSSHFGRKGRPDAQKTELNLRKMTSYFCRTMRWDRPSRWMRPKGALELGPCCCVVFTWQEGNSWMEFRTLDLFICNLESHYFGY